MFEGAVCETSAECGSLKCIEERCRDPFAVPEEEPRAPLGHAVWFGNGKGYGTIVAAIDIAATAIEPLLMVGTQASQGEQQTILGVICFAPVTFAGSTVHFAHGRVAPGLLSFFAWPSHVATTFVVGGLFGLAFEHGFEFNSAAAWAAGLTFGAIGAAALTWLDVWMARAVARKPVAPSFSISPSFAPTRGGALAGIGGSF